MEEITRSEVPVITEEKSRSVFPVALKYGIIVGLIQIIISAISYALDMPQSGVIQLLSISALIIGAFFAMKDHRDKNLGGFISYGRALGTGLLVTLICSLITAVYFFIFTSFIDTEYINVIMEKQEQAMHESGTSDEDIAMMQKYSKPYMTPFWMSVSVIGVFFLWGLLSSLVLAAFVKRRPQYQEGS